MTFLNSSFLWFSALAAIPVIIHFINRSTVKSIEFPTLRFLMLSSKKILRRFELLQWLLLILRVAIIILLTMAFARPVWKGYIGDNEDRHNIILIDNSYSMSYRTGRGSALDLSKDIAVELVKKLYGRFSLGVINNGLEILYPVTSNKEDLIKKIRDIENSVYTTDITGGVDEALSILDSENSLGKEKNMVILSDFNDKTIEKDFRVDDVSEIKFLLIDTSDGDRNIWIEDVDVETAYAGMLSGIKAVINTKKQANIEASLVIEKKKRNMKIYELSSRSEVKFNYKFVKPGTYKGWIEIESNAEQDRIDIDNVFYFHVKVKPRISILIVDGTPGYTLMGGESYFITKALNPGNYDTPVTVRVINPEELHSIKIKNYDVMYLLNVMLTSEISEKVSTFSSYGKGIGIFLGNNMEYRAYNNLISALMPVEISSMKPVDIEGIAEIKVSEKFNKMFSKEDTMELNKVYETQALGNFKPEITVTGVPLLWLYAPESFSAKRMALFTTEFDMDWSDFPLKPAYPVFVHELTLYLAGEKENDSAYKKIGWEIYNKNEEDNLSIKIEGKNVEISKDITVENKYAVIPGNYTVLNRKKHNKVLTVNIDTESGESKLINTDLDSFKKYYGQNITYIPYSNTLNKDIIRIVTGKEKSSIFLLAVFFLLVVEEILRKWLKYREN